MTQSQSPEYEVGYRKPPRKNQFKKGQSGNRSGKPKLPEGVNISEVLDTQQRGKNGEMISSREAIVIRLFNDAMKGKQKAFSKFLHFMNKSGLFRCAAHAVGGGIIYLPKPKPSESPSPKTYAAWLRKVGRHDEANSIDPQ
jgi:hypothetical protein